MNEEEPWLEPGARVRRRYGDQGRHGTVQHKVGYIEGKGVYLVWRYVAWDSGKSTVYRAVDLIEVESTRE